MRARYSSRIGFAWLLLLLPFDGASAGERWLHVRVEESGAQGEKVSVNVPLSVVESMLPLVQVDNLERGKLRLDVDELEGLDLREILGALNDSPDATFVRIESGDESVRVAKEKGYLLVHVDEQSGDAERVRIRLPLAVAEALVGRDSGELDLVAALRALEQHDGEDLVRVESADELVRIWIDSSDVGER